MLLRDLVTRSVLRDAVGNECVAMGRNVSAGCNECYPRRALRLFELDCDYSRMRMRRAHESKVEHARKTDVSHIASASAQQAPDCRARNRLPDQCLLFRKRHSATGSES